MKLCIAEKPSVAKEIAQVLGANIRKDGFFEGNGYAVSWVFGHLCTLKEPHDYLPEWKRWDLTKLPMIPSRFGIKLIQDKGVEKQFQTIKQLVSQATEVINCGDAGQEGEVIQRWVLTKSGCKVPIKRLWISSLTEEAIRQGFADLKDSKLFEQLYQAGLSRAVGDWLLGINLTRLYTIKYGRGKHVLSVGRVQTPTLGLIVKRHREITEFQPETYWGLKTAYKGAIFTCSQAKFTSKEAVQRAFEQIKEEEIRIEKIERKRGKENPPNLFDLTSLQVENNKKHGFSAEDTLKYAQALYEKKLITYPRVDTTFLSEDLEKKVPQVLKRLDAYEKLCAPLLRDGLQHTKKIFNNNKITDHHAIIPTGVSSRSLSAGEQTVFDMVALRFIAAFYPSNKFDTTTVNALIGKMKFKASGKTILDQGWHVVLKKDPGVEGGTLPPFKEGEQGVHEPQIEEKKTTPPKPFTEASLLRAMETAGRQLDDEELKAALKENGIGRPSTRANIIETLVRREYIKKERKNLKPTEVGIALIDTIEEELLTSVQLTGVWEQKLRDIEQGEGSAQKFMQELKQLVNEVVFKERYNRTKKHIVIENSSEDEQLIVCPNCKEKRLRQVENRFSCTNEGKCKFTIETPFLGKKITPKILSQLEQSGQTNEYKTWKLDSGCQVPGKLLLSDIGKVTFSISEDKLAITKLNCPVCKRRSIIKGNTAWGCAHYKECRFIIPFLVGGTPISEQAAIRLVLEGRVNLGGKDYLLQKGKVETIAP